MHHLVIMEVLSSNCIVAHLTLEELEHYCWALPVLKFLWNQLLLVKNPNFISCHVLVSLRITEVQ